MMKVLWITNISFPDVCEVMSLPVPYLGGWMYSSAKELLSINSTIKLAVASIYMGKELKTIEVNSIVYYLLPIKKMPVLYSSSLEDYWRIIKNEFAPDVVHIHGTEYAHGLGYIKVNGAKNVVVSIQGLVRIIARYYYSNIRFSDIFRNITFRDIIREDSIINQKVKLERRGMIELEYLQKVNNVIGRTTWDKAHVSFVNREMKYYSCNETLRSAFYHYCWDLNTCNRHTIFLSQGSYPIKGLHQVLKAMPYILKKHPDTKLYISGESLLVHGLQKIKENGYQRYIDSLIRKYHLSESVCFLGKLNEQEICRRYLKSHVFVCPSSIENSPNSLGEAQLLGVPVIASWVGGIPDMVEHLKTGLLYRFEEYEMLAFYICRIFEDDNLASDLSVKGKEVAAKRHDPKLNALTLSNIYNDINQ